MRLAAPIFVALLLSGARASAQDAETEAHILFERAMEDLQAGRRDAAILALRESLETHPTPAAAFNLAVALADGGDTREAVEVLHGLIDGRYGELAGDRADAARALMEEARGDLAIVEIEIRGAHRATIIVGSQSWIAESPAIAIAIGPGQRSIRVESEGRVPFVREIEVEPRSEASLEVSLANSAVLERPRVDPIVRDRSIEEEPLLWVSLGGGAALALAIVIFAVVLTDTTSAPALGIHETLLSH